jgi:hypothetical protein
MNVNIPTRESLQEQFHAVSAHAMTAMYGLKRSVESFQRTWAESQLEEVTDFAYMLSDRDDFGVDVWKPELRTVEMEMQRREAPDTRIESVSWWYTRRRLFGGGAYATHISMQDGKVMNVERYLYDDSLNHCYGKETAVLRGSAGETFMDNRTLREEIAEVAKVARKVIKRSSGHADEAAQPRVAA